MRLTAPTFSATLQELYSAMHAPEGMAKTLVPNLAGNTLFDKRAGKGRIYNNCYTEAVQKRLTTRALVRMQLTSQQCLQECAELIQKVQLCFENRCQGVNTSAGDEDYARLKQQLAYCEVAFLPFYRLVATDAQHRQNLKDFIDQHCGEATAAVSQVHPIWLWLSPEAAALLRRVLAWLASFIRRVASVCDRLYGAPLCLPMLDKWTAAKSATPVVEPLQAAQAFAATTLLAEIDKYLPIIHFEALTGISWPVREMTKLALGIDQADEKVLKKWLEDLTKCPHAAVSSSWRPALLAFHQLLATLPRGPGVVLKESGELEWMLAERYGGEAFFAREDPDHIQWRQAHVVVGETLRQGDLAVVVGAPVVQATAGKNDHHVHFETPSHPQQLVCVAHNCSTLSIEKWRQHYRLGGFESAAITVIEAQGRWALVEKLTEPLAGRSWVSSCLPLDAGDAEYLTAVRNQVRFFLEHGNMPIPLVAAHHFFNVEGFLKRCHLAKKVVPIDWLVLEKYLKEVASGNEVVFKELMLSSGLNQHADAIYWRSLVQKSCQGLRCDPALLATTHVISGPAVIEHGAKLLLEIDAMRATCRQALLQTTDKGDEAFEKRLNMALWTYYSHPSHSAAQLAPNFAQIVIAVMQTSGKSTIARLTYPPLT